MPMKSRRPRRFAKKRYAKKRFTRRPRTTNVPEWASMSETKDVGVLQTGTSYNTNDVQLSAFPRASAVAQGYNFYRIKLLKFTLQPLLDTFASTGATQVPYLHWVINRAGNAFGVLNKDWYLQNGAKPIRFDDKSISIQYRPAVILDGVEASSATGAPNLPKISPWLTTNADSYNTGWNPSTISHGGHFQLITSEGSAQPISYRMTMTAEFQFRKPLSKLPSSTDVGAHPVLKLFGTV